MTHRIEDRNRRSLNFAQDNVKDILPEYFLSDYPKLINILESYYDYLDSTNDQSFKREIDNLYSIRDITQTTEEHLDELIKEIGDGLQSASFFKNPRLMAKLLAGFYRSKGTLVSAEGFFRGFYDQEVNIEYPKYEMFTINDANNNYLSHQIGYDSLKFIQDNRRYQVFSILVKSGLSVSDYENLYKKLVHPAGFHFAGEVILETQGITGPIGLTGVDSDEIRGERAVDPVLVAFNTESITSPFTQITSIVDSNGTEFRIRPDRYLEDYATITAIQLDTYYDNTVSIIDPNSFTTDDDSSVSANHPFIARPDAAITVETMDAELFDKRYVDSGG